MNTDKQDRNAHRVLEAFDALFNRHDFAAAESFWSPNYIQHSPALPPGRDGLFVHVKALPTTVKYEHHVVATSGEFVIAHGRFAGAGLPKAIISANILRIEDDMFAEHWEVLQAEVSRAESKSGLPMFGTEFPS
ncbi:nuclear transport factor 2 family protein [Mycobacterium colombiense]